MICTAISNSGLFTGLWHGLTAFICFVLDIVWDVQVYDKCNDSWWYNLGFLVGFAITVVFGVFGPEIFVAVLVISVIVYIVWWVVGAILWGVAIGIALLLAFFVFAGGRAFFLTAVGRFRKKTKSFKQADGSEVIPP